MENYKLIIFYQRRQQWLMELGKENDLVYIDKSRFLQRDTEIDSVINSLKNKNIEFIEVKTISEIKTLCSKTENFEGKVVGWNITDGYDIYLGANFPSMMNLFGVPFIMEETYIQALSQNKHHFKSIIEKYNIKTPKWAIITNKSKFDEISNLINFNGPYFIKPASLDNSIGLEPEKSYFLNKKDAIIKAMEVSKSYDTPILLEEFIDGTDETVPYAFYDNKLNLSCLKEVYEEKFQSNKLKDNRSKKIERVKGKNKDELINVTKKLIEIFKLKSYGRFDFRRNKEGELYFFEFNAGTSLTCLSFESFLKEQNISLGDFLQKMIESKFQE